MATYTKRMRALLVQARGCIHSELMSAGADEVNSHPALQGDNRLLGRINKFLQEPVPEAPVLTAKEKQALFDALGSQDGEEMWDKAELAVLRRVADKLRKVLA